MTSTPSQSNASPADRLLTFCIVAGSSILFCSKGVIAKMAYARGADYLTVLTLRMGFSLPFFLLIILFAPRGARRLEAREWATLATLGFFGYYISSLVNFAGLEHVSVGLERIILYTYPSLILLFSTFVLRKPVRPVIWVASIVSWLGIASAFAGEMHAAAGKRNAPLGAALVFLSAVTYAIFILMSSRALQRVGPMRFTGITAGFSCIFMLAHYFVARPAAALFALPRPVYVDGLILALLGTVAPALLMSVGLKRAGAQRFAIIGAIGPVATLVLAWLILGETPNVGQGLGFLLTISGGVAATLLKDPPVAPEGAAISRPESAPSVPSSGTA